MTDQIDKIQHIGARTIMELLKNMPLPSTLLQWNKIIMLQVTDRHNLNYVWVIHEGKWHILDGETSDPDIIIKGKEIEFVKSFTEAFSPNFQITATRGKFKDNIYIGNLSGKIIWYLKNLSPQLIAETEQRQTEALALQEEAGISEIKQPTFLDEEIYLLVNKPEQLNKLSVGCPKCKSRKITSQAYYIDPKNGEKIPVTNDSKKIGVFAEALGILLIVFGLFLLIVLLAGGGIGNNLFAISAIILLIVSGLWCFREGIRIITANRQQQGRERIIENTCSMCKMVWNDGDGINK